MLGQDVHRFKDDDRELNELQKVWLHNLHLDTPHKHSAMQTPILKQSARP